MAKKPRARYFRLPARCFCLHSSPTPLTSPLNVILQSRYVVANVHGLPAWLVAKLFWLLPDRAADALMAKQDKVFDVTEAKT